MKHIPKLKFGNVKSIEHQKRHQKKTEMGKIMKAYQERVVEEKKELDKKINKLFLFLKSEHKLEVGDLVLLKTQLTMMEAYSDILGMRIETFNG